MVKKAASARKEHSLLPSLLVIVMIPLWTIVSVLVAISVVVSMPTNGSAQSVYSSPELVSGVVALAAVVFNLSKLYDAAKSGKKELLHVYMLFTSATASFTLFLFVYPAYANMLDPRGVAYWAPLLAVEISLVLACLSLVGGVFYLLAFILGQWWDTSGSNATPMSEVSSTVEDGIEERGERGAQWPSKKRDAPFHLGLLLVAGGLTLAISAVSEMVKASPESWGTWRFLILSVVGLAVVYSGWRMITYAPTNRRATKQNETTRTTRTRDT